MRICLAVLLLFAPLALRGQSARADSIAILRAFDAYANAHLQRNLPVICQTFAPDARLLPPDTTVVTGPTAICRYWQQHPAPDSAYATYLHEPLQIYGDNAWLRGLRSPKGIASILRRDANAFRYVILWHRQPDGQWRIVAELWHRYITMPLHSLAVPSR